MAHELDKLKVVDFNINLDDPDQAANLCDDTAFMQGMPKLQSITPSSSLVVEILIHPGMDDDKQIGTSVVTVRRSSPFENTHRTVPDDGLRSSDGLTD